MGSAHAVAGGLQGHSCGTGTGQFHSPPSSQWDLARLGSRSRVPTISGEVTDLPLTSPQGSLLKSPLLQVLGPLSKPSWLIPLWPIPTLQEGGDTSLVSLSCAQRLSWQVHGWGQWTGFSSKSTHFCSSHANRGAHLTCTLPCCVRPQPI